MHRVIGLFSMLVATGCMSKSNTYSSFAAYQIPIYSVKYAYSQIDAEDVWFAGAVRKWEDVIIYMDMPYRVRWVLTIKSVESGVIVGTFSGVADAGTVYWTWDGNDETGNPVRPGIYELRVETRDYFGLKLIALVPQ